MVASEPFLLHPEKRKDKRNVQILVVMSPQNDHKLLETVGVISVSVYYNFVNIFLSFGPCSFEMFTQLFILFHKNHTVYDSSMIHAKQICIILEI